MAVAAGTVVIIGVPTALIATPWFGREIPPTWWAWPVLLTTAVLSGLVTATYVSSPRPDSDRPADASRPGAVGGLLAYLAVGCPVCNKVALLALGSAGALQWFAPLQPLLAAAGIALLGFALRRRLQGERACPVASAPSTQVGASVTTAPDPHGHPAWYGAVMGTGALALAVAAQEPVWGWSWLGWVSVALLWLASALALVLLPRYVRRVGDRDRLRHEIADAAHGPMLATLPAGLLVLAVGWGRIGPDAVPAGVARGIAVALLVAGVLIATALGLVWSAAVLTASHGLEGVNGGWLIPPVMNLLVPLALAPLIVEFPDAATLLVLVGFAFLASGSCCSWPYSRFWSPDWPCAIRCPPRWRPRCGSRSPRPGSSGSSTLRLLQAAEAAGRPRLLRGDRRARRVRHGPRLRAVVGRLRRARTPAHPRDREARPCTPAGGDSSFPSQR